MTDAAQLRALIEALESAPQGGRELDILIAVCPATPSFGVVKGASLASVEAALDYSENCDEPIILVPHFTTSLDAALPGEEIVDVCRLYVFSDNPPVWQAWAFMRGHIARDSFVRSKAATEPLARRAAALRAMLHQMEKAG